MPPKRPRRANSVTALFPGEVLKRQTLAGNLSAPWGWVGTEVVDETCITQQHRLVTCGLSERNSHSFCRNKYAPKVQKHDTASKSDSQQPPVHGELENDVIVISDDDEPACSKKICKNNPDCLNYLGQTLWENEDDAREKFNKLTRLGENPTFDSKEPDLPVGLKNLGATCYANASLQVWFRDLAFRRGVYLCEPSSKVSEERFKDSPIFQLQVTFAALQESTQSVFNPTKLVESLQLRTAEQQDAQEFSKLFMSHLDAEFKKQSIPSVQSLITDQFQGKQVYGTRCHNCHNQSERETDFLELEINFEKKSKLEDCIATLLKPETLSGDNQYLCAVCESLQDATRYTELRSLPPVLHFSLLRFVFDIATLERKKSKHAICFPVTLDMNKFLGKNVAKKNAAPNDPNCDDNVYELRGVLLHKGASAYHGHYEAQVFDPATQSWFQFNDETVTKVKTLGDKVRPGKNDIVIDLDDTEYEDEKPTAAGKKQRADARKRRRVEDSEEEEPSKQSAVNDIMSKDAYMLVYARKERHLRNSSPESGQRVNDASQLVPSPPRRAMDEVKALNAAHDEACEHFDDKEKLVSASFDETRRQVRDIYQSWSMSSAADQNYVVVSQQALEKWLSKHCMEATATELRRDLNSMFDNEQASDSSRIPSIEIPLDDILCEHLKLDHRKANNMKRISQKAFDAIARETNCIFQHQLSQDDVCADCVRESFREVLYQIDHPRLVNEFDQIPFPEGSDSLGVWISKPWLKDWRLVKPKMHVASQGDPGPDSPEYDIHVRCEHGGLTINSLHRRRLSSQAAELIKTLYPYWKPLSTELAPCEVCENILELEEGDRRELKKQVETEKSNLRDMFNNGLGGTTTFHIKIPCAFVPIAFVRTWRDWLLRPADNDRPNDLDNTSFFCEHQHLNFDPNHLNDWQDTCALIKRSEWDLLEQYYTAGPLIEVQKHDEGDSYTHDIPVCNECRYKRRSDWETTDITVQSRGKGESVPPQTATAASRPSGARQSKRLRQGKQQHWKVSISRTTTVKDIKVKLQHLNSVPTLYQQLFYGDVELTDNRATVESLGILANDTLHWCKESDSDSEDQPRKKRREEGNAFGGTLLGGCPPTSSPTEEDPPNEVKPEPTEKSCSACTFSNSLDSEQCTMCDTRFS
ncbi:hypothetical protein C8J56DRAFT_866417 [Mycena floridula]|nr:hypothetical protein C8J56DRAFT_866417 [Mycena floridula]